MKLLTFYRRRYIIVPTILGMLFILTILGLLLYVFFQNVATFLAVNEPVGAEYLVVEGWLGKNELSQAFKAFDKGNYQNIIVTGGPTDDEFDQQNLTYAERAAKYLQSIGLPYGKIEIVSSPYSAQNRTFLSAVLVREWFNSQNIEVRSIDVFSGSVHSRRSRNLYQLAFGDDVNIGVLASKPNRFDLNLWWQSSHAATLVLKELIGLMVIKCCFNPDKIDPH